MTSTGTNGPIVITEQENEKFLLMVKKENGKIETVEAAPELYYKKEIGQRIKCAYNKGLITNLDWSIEALQ